MAYYSWILEANYFTDGIPEDLSFFSFLAICFFHLFSIFCLFLLFILDFKFILISPPMLGCTVLSLVNVCLFPQSARSAGLRVIPTAWHFRLWVCLPLLTSPTSVIPPSNPSILMYWQTLMWTNSSQLTKGLSKHSSISCNVVLFCLWVCILTRQITLNLAEANFACYVLYSPADTRESNVLFKWGTQMVQLKSIHKGGLSGSGIISALVHRHLLSLSFTQRHTLCLFIHWMKIRW